MMRVLRILFLTLPMLLILPCFAEGREWEEVYEEANRYFSRGIDAEGEQRDTLINTAAGLYERIIREGGISNGYLYYNLGNCYLVQGEIGKAILNYRRAERLIPGFGNLRENGYDFMEIWLSERAHEIRRQIRKTKCFCTHECFLNTNLFFNIRNLPPIAKRWAHIKSKGKLFPDT